MENQAEKPQIRELVLKNDITFATDEELLMLMLGSGNQQTHVEELAHKVLFTIENTDSENWTNALLKINGIGKTKALLIEAALELGRRKSRHLNAVINKPEDLIPFVKHFTIEQKEHFLCITLNGAHELQRINVISIGTINKTLVHPREVFCEAVTQRASGIICVHNHPYGQCLPSEADIQTTTILRRASDIMSIAFLDHIIITKDGYFSFKEHGMLEEKN